MKKISIVVPVYNVEKYLERCLESLTNQTLEDIEIILVNDGSIDASQTIIDKYKNRFPNKIKSFYIKNGGAAKARNFALNQVTGEYIGFVDSDDYISEEMYEKMYEKAKKASCSGSCCYNCSVSLCWHLCLLYRPRYGNCICNRRYFGA